MNQARALGRHWASTPITAVYCSDLKRAHSTAQALVAGQVGQRESGAEAEKGIEPIATHLLREQHFGVVEGKPWAAAPDSSPNAKTEAEQVYYTIHTRHDKFEGGESLDDVACRADEAIDATVWPHVIEALRPRPLASFAADEGKGRLEDAHIVLVSHGITISELVAALLRRAPKSSSSHGPGPKALKGLANTGWTQVIIDIQPVDPGEANHDTADEAVDPTMVQIAISSIHIHSVNNAPHLVHVKRQAGGIGSSAHDEKQRGIREFFGGGGTNSNS